MKLCIFDLDGTLGDTRESLVLSVNETLKEMGLEPLPEKDVISMVGNGAKYLMERVVEARQVKDRFQESFDIYLRIFDDKCTEGATPYPGIMWLLEELKKQEILLAVLSNKPHAQTVKVVEAMCGKDIFDLVYGQKEGVRRKPAPDGVFEIMKELQLSKEEVLYIGDSEVDVETAANAGVQSAIVSWGFRSREFLLEKGAENIVDNTKELLKFALK